MLAQPAQAWTDLVLGLITSALAISMYRKRAGHHRHHHWEVALFWLAVSALGGFFHHGFIVRISPSAANVSFTIISVAVVLGVSYLLAGTVEEVLGPGHRKVFWTLRSAGLLAYLGLAITNGAGVNTLVLCESITFFCILGLWIYAARERVPLAVPVLIAIVASGAAAAAKALPPSITGAIHLDTDSIYHLTQIVGIVLLYWAITTHPGREDLLPSIQAESLRVGTQGPAPSRPHEGGRQR